MKKRDLAQDLIDLEQFDDFWQQARDKVLIPKHVREPILDVGCGTGIVTKPLIEKGFDVYSIDIDKKACDKCRMINKNTYCIDFTKVNAKKFPLFNTIIMADALEHIKEDMTTLNKAFEMLNPGGELLISVPYHNFFWTVNDFVRHHVRRYSKKGIKEKLRRSGFKVSRLKFWNLLALGPILVGKLLHLRVPHESISKSKFNPILKNYFIYFENHLPLPIGSELIITAKKANIQNG